MGSDDAKATLHRYLQMGREAVLWKLEGLTEYDLRRPLVPSGTNLLGLVKHLATVEIGYFGMCFGRPWHQQLPWLVDGADPTDDLWALPHEPSEEIVGFYRDVWAHADETIRGHDLADVGRVPWWPPDRAEVSLHTLLVHMATETHRHAGHADIVRELIDGAAGLRADNDNLAGEGTAWFEQFHDRVEQAARTFLPEG